MTAAVHDYDDVWNSVYAAAEDDGGTWDSRPLPAVELVNDIISRTGAATVLDSGCGDGRNLVAIAAKASFAVGTDISSVALHRAARTLRAQAIRNVVLLHDDVIESRFVSDAFDVVICLAVLAHLYEPQKALRELVRICKPGGCIVTDVFGLGDETRESETCNEGADDHGVYFRYYSADESKALGGSCDAAVLKEVHEFTWIDPPHGSYRPYRHRHQTWCLVLQKR